MTIGTCARPSKRCWRRDVETELLVTEAGCKARGRPPEATEGTESSLADSDVRTQHRPKCLWLRAAHGAGGSVADAGRDLLLVHGRFRDGRSPGSGGAPPGIQHRGVLGAPRSLTLRPSQSTLRVGCGTIPP